VAVDSIRNRDCHQHGVPPLEASGRAGLLYGGRMTAAQEAGFPVGNPDERELLISWLGFLRGTVIRKLNGLSDEQARWKPDDKLISLLGIVNHLTHVEWRWIDGGIRGHEVFRDEEEFVPGPDLTVEAAVAAYRRQGESTAAVVRASVSLGVPCRLEEGADLRWVLLHLINETARHAGHADAVRELLDGVTGE